MKIFIGLFLLFSIGHTTKTMNSYIPNEFQYPDNEIGTGKIFIYENIITKEKAYKDLKLVSSIGENYRLLKSYGLDYKSDSVKSLNGKTVEAYNFFFSGNGNVVKGVKIQDTVLVSGHKLGTRISKWGFNTEGLLYKTISEETFLKDTLVTWKNKELPCIVTQGNAKIEQWTTSGSSISLVNTTNLSGKFYHAKGIGMFKYSVGFVNHDTLEANSVFVLKEIKNID